MNYYKLWWLLNESIRLRTAIIQKTSSDEKLKEAQRYNFKAIPILYKIENKLKTINEK